MAEYGWPMKNLMTPPLQPAQSRNNQKLHRKGAVNTDEIGFGHDIGHAPFDYRKSKSIVKTSPPSASSSCVLESLLYVLRVRTSFSRGTSVPFS